jgi:hypothetical protein
MTRALLNDPKARRAYVVTKVAVFAIAAFATIPLARVVGPKAWVGLAIFGGLLAVMTVVALFVPLGGESGSSSGGSRQLQPDLEEDDEFDPEEPVEIPVEDCLDLHPFPPRDVPDVVASFLEAAHEKGFTEVRLIHGRGIGVQRERVQKLLARHPLVSGFHDAPPARGGWGATVAYLKPTGG